MRWSYRTVNRVDELEPHIQRLTQVFESEEGVVGVMFGGGIGRGMVDEFSDVDMYVWVRNKRCKNRLEGVYPNIHYAVEGYEFDFEFVDLEYAWSQEVPSSRWNDIKRLEMLLSKITYDPNHDIERLKARVCVFSDRERDLKLDRELAAVNWHLCNAEAWCQRGSLPHAFNSLTSAANHVIYYVYARNKKFVPDNEKWKFLWFEAQEIPETQYYKDLAELYVMGSYTESGIREKQDRLFQLLRDLRIPSGTPQHIKESYRTRPDFLKYHSKGQSGQAV